MIYINKSSAARILNIVAKKIINLIEMKNGCINVVYFGNDNKKCARFVSRKMFFNDAISIRKNSSDQEVLKVTHKNGFSFEVKNPLTGKQYLTEITSKSIGCTCDDIDNQIQHGTGFQAKPVCKHIFKLASYLGFGSIKEAMNGMKAYEQLAA